jgi:type IV secretion system protein VirB10
MPAGGEELYSTDNRQPADGLAGLPRDYTGPVLGPPLPGDLGRPILDAQNGGSPSYRRRSRRPPWTEEERRSPRKKPRAPAASFPVRGQARPRPGTDHAGLAGLDLAA